MARELPQASPFVFPSSPRPAVQHVVVLFLENQNVSTVLQYATYQHYLAGHYAFASQFYSIKHGSAYDYVAATSGNLSNRLGQGGANVADLADGAGLSWAGFLESMPKPCDGASSGPYSPVHNPFVYYSDIANDATRCRSHDLPLSDWQWELTAGSLPAYSYVSPNEYDDGHTLTPANTSIASAAATPRLQVQQADSWLRGFLEPLLNSSLASGTVFLVVYDESSSDDKLTGSSAGGAGGHVYALAAGGPGVVRPSYRSALPYNTYSVLTTAEWLLGPGSTRQHDNWTSYPPMYDLFAPSPLSSVSGRAVAKCSGIAVAGATISNTVFVAASASATGQYAIGNISQGSYNLTASAPGYEAAKTTVLVSGSAPASVDFRLGCFTAASSLTSLKPVAPVAILRRAAGVLVP